MILLKLGDEYKLYSHDSCIATTQESPHKKLSKQNCDEIFGVVDVEKLAESHAEECYERNGDPLEESYFENRKYNFKEGFNKAMELNKDKLFTVEDIKKAFNAGWVQRHNEEGSHYENMETLIKSLQQPKEIEVEIEMEIVNTQFNPGATCIQDSTYISVTKKSKLDVDGCLILKKL